MSKGSKLEDKFLVLITEAAPEITIERQVKVIKGRKFAYDFCLPEQRVLIEIQGGTFSGGRHTRGYGYSADCEKLRLATFDGWKILWYDSKSINTKEIERLVEYVRTIGVDG